MVSLAIFDYGAGNIFSLKNSLERQGATVHVITSLDTARYDGLLLPGVGNFDPAMQKIAESEIKFKDYVGTTPVLGICLGMEMFFERSQEGTKAGLGIMGGEVVILPPAMKVPHMGWNGLEVIRPGRILDGVPDGSWVYFVHSYMARPAGSIVTAESDYGIRVPAVVEQGNYFGTQFHPEKSGSAGRVILQNFIEECKR